MWENVFFFLGIGWFGVRVEMGIVLKRCFSGEVIENRSFGKLK